MDKHQYTEVFKWYTEWLLNHENREDIIFSLLDNLKQTDIDAIVEIYKQQEND